MVLYKYVIKNVIILVSLVRGVLITINAHHVTVRKADKNHQLPLFFNAYAKSRSMMIKLINNVKVNNII